MFECAVYFVYLKYWNIYLNVACSQCCDFVLAMSALDFFFPSPLPLLSSVSLMFLIYMYIFKKHSINTKPLLYRFALGGDKTFTVVIALHPGLVTARGCQKVCLVGRLGFFPGPRGCLFSPGHCSHGRATSSLTWPAGKWFCMGVPWHNLTHRPCAGQN